jgi:hypothetical protein
MQLAFIIEFAKEMSPSTSDYGTAMVRVGS